MTLAIPPPIALVEERREIGLPASPGGGTHGLPSWSELEGSGGDAARPEAEHSPMVRGVEIVEIPCSGEAGARVELAMVQSSHDVVAARSSSGLGVNHEQVWPYLGGLRKAQFILHDDEEVDLPGGERTIDGVRPHPNQGEAQGGLGAS